MELLLSRTDFTAETTIDEQTANGTFEHFTPEDKVCPVKIKGVTAIPAGSYEVLITFSERHHRQLPMLLITPNIDGIRLHASNTAVDTGGCIVVGQPKRDLVGASRPALYALFKKLGTASTKEKPLIHAS
ncbi:MAG: DUF5675 family protein [Dokdonella sp.]|nr:hypothetical protein [Dokdonella sp.]